jgi:steroid delta-isomerase-like uncharacterized protein
MTSGSTSSAATTPRRLVERFYDDAWNRGDEETAREILHHAFRFRGSLGTEASDIEGYLAYLRMVRAALPGFTCTIKDLIEGGQRIAARMLFSGTHRGEVLGVAGSGREVSWEGAAFFTIADGRIVELWVLGDLDALKRQLAA